MVLGNAGAAFVYEQKELDNSDKVIEKIKYLYENPEEIEKMAKNASELYVKDTNDRIYEVLCRNCSALTAM
jgi:UDP-N-acetylglucosamine:LPS N-acetylglucosamine transferase